MKIVPFHVEHLWQIRAQPEQVAEVTRELTADYAAYLAKGLAYTAMDEGRILGVAGIVETGPNVGVLWGVVSGDCKRQFIGMWRAVRRILEVAHFATVKTTTNFPAGCRALELLDFECRGQIGGTDHILYVRNP